MVHTQEIYSICKHSDYTKKNLNKSRRCTGFYFFCIVYKKALAFVWVYDNIMYNRIICNLCKMVQDFRNAKNGRFGANTHHAQK